MRSIDADDAEVPRGVVGEVVVRGPNVMLGYWEKPEETAAALRDGWMHTGDAAWMDDEGYIYIVDRFKDMIVSGGENDYSAEVERAIGAHPLVGACARSSASPTRSGASACTRSSSRATAPC